MTNSNEFIDIGRNWDHINTVWCIKYFINWSFFTENIVRTLYTQNLDPGNVHYLKKLWWAGNIELTVKSFVSIRSSRSHSYMGQILQKSFSKWAKKTMPNHGPVIKVETYENFNSVWNLKIGASVVMAN